MAARRNQYGVHALKRQHAIVDHVAADRPAYLMQPFSPERLGSLRLKRRGRRTGAGRIRPAQGPVLKNTVASGCTRHQPSRPNSVSCVFTTSPSSTSERAHPKNRQVRRKPSASISKFPAPSCFTRFTRRPHPWHRPRRAPSPFSHFSSFPLLPQSPFARRFRSARHAVAQHQKPELQHPCRAQLFTLPSTHPLQRGIRL